MWLPVPDPGATGAREFHDYAFHLGHEGIGSPAPKRGIRTGLEHMMWLGNRVNETVNDQWRRRACN